MKRDAQNLKTLARQYGWMRSRGDSHDQALASLSHLGGTEFQRLLNRLASVQQGFTSTDPFVTDQLGALASVLDRSDADGAQRSALLLGALGLSDEISEIGKRLRQTLVTRYTYMMVICVVGLCVSSVYAVYVYPQLSAMPSLFGPSTKISQSALYDLGILGYPVVFLALFALTALTYFLSLRSSYELGSGKNFAAPLHRLPGISTLNEALRSYLYMGIRQLGARSGLGAAHAAQLAESIVSGPTADQEQALQIAEKLDTLEKELEYQRSQTTADVEHATRKAASLWNGALTAITAIIIFTMITDYYRPLFKMGAI